MGNFDDDGLDIQQNDWFDGGQDGAVEVEVDEPSKLK
jgi:hypothetical protein